MRRLPLVFGVLVLVLGTAHVASAADRTPRPNSAALKIIQQVLDTPEDKIDFARAKLAFDKIIDSSIDADRTLREINGMVSTVRVMAGPNATTMQKLIAVRRFIYVDGDWNGHRPFAYDLTDPLGRNIKNKLLATYLETRRGNCVSMPVLFSILADRLGLHVTLSTAPSHLFVKFTNDAGKTYNLETTSGALPSRDEWYRQTLPMTDAAIRNGLYMKTLSKTETVAVMAGVVLEHFMTTKRYHDAVTAADLLLKRTPQNVNAILTKGSAYGALIESEFQSKFPTPNDIPIESRAAYQRYVAENRQAFERAEALGWRETDGEKLKGTLPVK